MNYKKAMRVSAEAHNEVYEKRRLEAEDRKSKPVVVNRSKLSRIAAMCIATGATMQERNQ